MKRLVLLIAIGFFAWQGYTKYQSRHEVEPLSESIEQASDSAPQKIDISTRETPSRFSCDGRTYCSQMTSCAEATYFLKNCPGVKMDGNHDGVPCEQQWCR